jgi:hypothetical protein
MRRHQACRRQIMAQIEWKEGLCWYRHVNSSAALLTWPRIRLHDKAHFPYWIVFLTKLKKLEKSIIKHSSTMNLFVASDTSLLFPMLALLAAAFGKCWDFKFEGYCLVLTLLIAEQFDTLVKVFVASLFLKERSDIRVQLDVDEAHHD